MENYLISSKQKEDFNTNGFLLLPNAVPNNLLSKWQHLLNELETNLLNQDNKSSLSEKASFSFIEASEKPLLSRANDLLGIYPDGVLDLMACPSIMAIMKMFCGSNAIPLHCDALFKHNHPESAVLWHQDAIHSRKFPYLTIGIYLDDSEVDDGCLNYVANTQYKPQDICKLVSENEWNIPGKICVPAKAGDILIHDMMILHSSQMKRKKGVRRTIYIEIRPAEAVLDQGYQSKKWTELRKRWMGLVLRRSNTEWSKELFAEISEDLKTDKEEIEQILNHKEAPIPARYCIGKNK